MRVESPLQCLWRLCKKPALVYRSESRFSPRCVGWLFLAPPHIGVCLFAIYHTLSTVHHAASASTASAPLAHSMLLILGTRCSQHRVVYLPYTLPIFVRQP